jgi:hypothetical protein
MDRPRALNQELPRYAGTLERLGLRPAWHPPWRADRIIV